jgi:DNA modification methylase
MLPYYHILDRVDDDGSPMIKQQSFMLDCVLDSYASGEKSNKSLYQDVASSLNIDAKNHVKPIGKSGTRRNTFHQRIRWAQQSLKHTGLIENIGHGHWQLTQEGKQQLTRVHADKYMVAATTDLGVAIWGNSLHVFDQIIEEDIHLCITSPPYLNIARSYGTHWDEQGYLDFIISVLTPIRRRMVPGANLALNISNDSILKKTFGARSLYLEALILRLSGELDLHLMDRLIWNANDKAPKSTQVTKKRTHLTSKYEPILWFCNAPEHCLADNRRVLNPYTPQMKKLIAQGGDVRKIYETDYAANSRTGGFSRDNGGSIAGNVLSFPTHCQFNRAIKKHARALDLPTHGAVYPVALASFLIRWLCPEEGFVVDPFGGYSTSGFAAESTGRAWATCELHWEYVKPALLRFTSKPGYWLNPKFEALSDPALRFHYAS